MQRLSHSYQHNTTLAEFAYTVDLLGNWTQVTEALRQPNDTLITKTIDYAYDGLSRLLSADYSTGETYAYEYDLAGNRTKKTVDETPTNYTYNAANQITSGGITYDDAGRMTSDGTNSLTWDRADRLLAYNGVENLYNGLGQRVSQTVSSIVTEYLLDVQPGLFVTLTETAQGNTKRFIHGPRGIHALQDAANDWAWLLGDGLGSVRAEVNAGLVDDVGEYAVNGVQGNTPFGIPRDVAGTFGSTYGFTGEPTDYNDLVYMRARYLNPEMGVFPSLDPFEGVIQRAMSLNGYSWVEGNVPNMIDPTGMIDEQPGDGCSVYQGIGSCEHLANEHTVREYVQCRHNNPYYKDACPLGWTEGYNYFCHSRPKGRVRVMGRHQEPLLSRDQKRQPLLHVKVEGSIGVDVRIEQGRQRPPIGFSHALIPARLSQDMLQHQGIDVDQAIL